MKIHKKYNNIKEENIIVVKPSFGNVPVRPLQDIQSLNVFSK